MKYDKKNSNGRVVVFVLTTTIVMLSYSFCTIVYDVKFCKIENVNILSDIVTVRKKQDTGKKVPAAPLVAVVPAPIADTSSKKDSTVPVVVNFENYKLANSISVFSGDTSRNGLNSLMRKLSILKKTGKGKVRIAWLGDSMIEGDLLTETVRKRLQEFFGGCGVGFIPVTSVVAKFRSSVRHHWEGNWKEESFRTDGNSAPMFLSGHTFFTNAGKVSIKDVTIHDTITAVEKSVICGRTELPTAFDANGRTVTATCSKLFNNILLDNSNNHTVDLYVKNNKLPVYGVSFESKDGVIIDNFSFRGTSGVELTKLDSAMLATLDSQRVYDLVIFEYGANVLFHPDDTDYSWYGKHVIAATRKFCRLMPHSAYMVISSADRAFKYGDSWKTAVGINNLIRTQASLAQICGASFYNMYASMGGSGTIVSWAEGSPQLANKDYIHPNQRGAEKLGNMFFEAFMDKYNKTIQ
jgi:hypothetical protein